MATKLRLQRHGKKGKPFYYIVAADSRAKRDGKNIEKFGTYNPNTNPATIDMDFDRALHWVRVGAQPTDTVRAILSYRGVLHMAHLLRGVDKGALKDNLSKAAQEAAAKKAEAEKAVSEKRAAEIAAKNTPPADETAEEATEEAATEDAPESTEE
jgi:small subunit ribosomal protein S16